MSDRLEQQRKAEDAELVRRNHVSDRQDWVPGLKWPTSPHLWPCGCLKNDAGAHRVGCPDHSEEVRGS